MSTHSRYLRWTVPNSDCHYDPFECLSYRLRTGIPGAGPPQSHSLSSIETQTRILRRRWPGPGKAPCSAPAVARDSRTLSGNDTDRSDAAEFSVSTDRNQWSDRPPYGSRKRMLSVSQLLRDTKLCQWMIAQSVHTHLDTFNWFASSMEAGLSSNICIHTILLVASGRSSFPTNASQ